MQVSIVVRRRSEASTISLAEENGNEDLSVIITMMNRLMTCCTRVLLHKVFPRRQLHFDYGRCE